MKRLISMATATGLLAGALLLPAMIRAEEHGGGEAKLERMREKLGISEEQAAKLKAARRAKRDASEASRTEMKAAMRKLSDQLEDKASDKDIAATLDKIASARKAQRAEMEKFEAGISAILTPTQRAKMLVAMKKHGGMRGGKRGGMRQHDDD